MHPERITQKDKGLVNSLVNNLYDGVGFPLWEKDFSKI